MLTVVAPRRSSMRMSGNGMDEALTAINQLRDAIFV
jgi:hypothetical protein